MKTYEIREMGLDGVLQDLDNLEEIMANLIFQHHTNQLDNPLKFRITRREIARLKTIIREHELGINPLVKTEAETELFTQTYLVGEVSLEDEKTFYSANPSIVPVFCSVFSFWIFGMNILFWLKNKFRI